MKKCSLLTILCKYMFNFKYICNQSSYFDKNNDLLNRKMNDTKQLLTHFKKKNLVLSKPESFCITLSSIFEYCFKIDENFCYNRILVIRSFTCFFVEGRKRKLWSKLLNNR